MIKTVKYMRWTLIPQLEATPQDTERFKCFHLVQDDTVSEKKITTSEEAGNQQTLKVVVALDSTVDQLVMEMSRPIRRILTTWKQSPWRKRWMRNCVLGT